MSELELQISTEKKKLDEFLNSKIGDQSWLLGFFQQLHPKFLSWIIKDFNGYFEHITVDKIQVKFTTIDLVQRVWSDFHYPIIKYFQYNHALIVSQIDSQFAALRKDENNPGKFKVKPVEIRKINDSYIKFSKYSYQFYHSVLKHFATHFANPLLPKVLLRHFNLQLQSQPIETMDTNLQANLLYLLHRSLVALGDICRHRSFVEVNYVNPCISNKEYFKFRSLNNKEKSTALKPFYEKSLQFYQLCILLLPALNEPYNHIGVIHNLIDDKYLAVLWFLRSQFTRIPHYKLGLDNLLTVLKKRWFLDNVHDIDVTSLDAVKKRSKSSFNRLDELNIALVCLCGYYYLPDTYRRGANISREMSYSKLESYLLKNLSDSFEELINDSEFMLNQLVVLFSFGKLIENSNDNENLGRFNKFAFRYIDKFLEGCIKSKNDNGLANRTNTAIIIRFTLNWIKENKSAFRTFQKFQFPMHSIKNGLNSLLESLTKEELSLIEFETRPSRSYYFKEDVMFKDFLLIKYQFKDFKDENLFASNNIDLLAGDYSSLVVNGVPTFLNAEVLMSGDSITAEISNYENVLRTVALVVLARKLLQDNNLGIEFDSAEKTFIATKATKNRAKASKSKPASKTSTKQTAKSVSSKSSSEEPEETKQPVKVTLAKRKAVKENDTKEQVDIPEPKTNVEVPFSIEDIQKSISSHASQLQEKLKITEGSELESSGEEDRLENMVESIISDTKTNDGTSSNIWGVNQPQQPFKIPNLESQQQFYNSPNATPSPVPGSNLTKGGPSPASASGPNSSGGANFYQPYPQYTQFVQYPVRDGMVSPYMMPPFVPNQFSPFEQPIHQPMSHAYGQFYPYEQYQPYYAMNPAQIHPQAQNDPNVHANAPQGQPHPGQPGPQLGLGQNQTTTAQPFNKEQYPQYQ